MALERELLQDIIDYLVDTLHGDRHADQPQPIPARAEYPENRPPYREDRR